MTVEQLNATPLYSKVTYQGTNAVILKIKDGGAILYDASSGWQSFVIPADYLTLVEAYTGQPGTAANIATAALYSVVTVMGTKGVIISKSVMPNSFTGIDYWVAMVWFPGTESISGYDDNQITFTNDGTTPPPNGDEIPSKSNNWLLYGAIAIGAYFLFFRKDKGPTA